MINLLVLRILAQIGMEEVEVYGNIHCLELSGNRSDSERGWHRARFSEWLIDEVYPHTFRLFTGSGIEQCFHNI